MSENSLPTYTFLPWLRQGIANNISNVDNLTTSGISERAEVPLNVKVNDSEIENNIKLIGPGDIIGINSKAIIRTEPRNWITDFEPNYLAFIEFYDEDFPWRYSPASANEDDRLRPWMMLAVLAEEEFERNTQLSGTLNVITIDGDHSELFPDPAQTWSWAHVHVSQDISNDGSHSVGEAVDELSNAIASDSDSVFSRLVCPRKLKEKTAYYAFLIPSFETGRLAGLNEETSDIDSLAPSWNNGQSQFPVYHEWFFRTGEKGDFEYLVSLLEPQPADEKVGIRDMDVQDPGFGVTGISEPPELGLEGALKSPQTQSTDWPPDPAPQFQNELEGIVNLQDDLQQEGGTTSDPIVTPPLYGKWHAMVSRLEISNDNWIHGLNSDPRFRVPGGFGTLVVQNNQETYMQSAWEQVGDVLTVNQKIRQGQLAIASSFAIFDKNITSLAPGQLLSVTNPVHSKILGSPVTIRQLIKDSKIPRAALSSAFRKIVRPRGAIMRKVAPGDKGKPNDLVNQLNDGTITASPPKTAPDGQISLDDVMAKTPSTFIPEWLKKLLKYNVLLFIILLLFLVIALFATGAVAVISIMAVIVTGLFGWSQRLKRQFTASADSISEENLTTEAVNEVPSNPTFTITSPGQPLPGFAPVTGNDSIEAKNLKNALLDLHERLEIKLPEEEPKTSLDIGNAIVKIKTTINPNAAITRRLSSVIDITGINFITPPETIVPVMAHPDFPYPMYEPLRDISSELLIPNLNLIPQNTISLLETNQPFIESYMVGLNHEMGRELLWREYPTDQRGSYFRQFWDVSEVVKRDETQTEEEFAEELRDIKPIHTWSKYSNLGEHNNRESDGDESQLVLVIRGELLKKYPNALIYAQKAEWQSDDQGGRLTSKHRILNDTDPDNNIKEPLYKAEVLPDLKFFGFDLTVEEAKGLDEDDPGWYFVIQERPGEPRFGLDSADEAATGNATEWNDLSWGHLAESDSDLESFNVIDLDKSIKANVSGDIQWATNSADMAYIMYQVPVMVAVHAEEMLE